jgi:hypothetical protein
MAEQSSAAVTFRALVMLVCLVAIPLAAVFGPSLPEVIKAAREGRWPVITVRTPGGSNSPGGLEEPPPFEPSAGAKPAVAATATPAPLPLPGQTPGSAPAAVPATGVMPARFESPAAPAGQDSSIAKLGEPLVSPPTEGPAAGVEPATLPPGADPFVAVQDRLRRLGATHYVLEFWGKDKYRFCCRMAVGGNPNVTRYFEAIKADPLQAMAEVARDVESWRAGRL